MMISLSVNDRAEQLSGPRTSIVTIKRIPNGGFVEVR